MGETPMPLSNTPCQSPLKQRAVARRVFKLPPKVVHPENSKPRSELWSPLRILTGQLALFLYEKSAHLHLKWHQRGCRVVFQAKWRIWTAHGRLVAVI